MTIPSQNPPWVLKKAVLVYAPDVDVSCFARLRIAHDKTANQGSVSLGILADLANLTRSHVLTLNVPPERVDECALARVSNDDLCSASLVSMLRAPVPNVSAISTLSMRLNATGVVLCPTEIKSISPVGQGDSNFHAFAKICQSKFLRVHFSRRQFVNRELDQLDGFSCALRERSLQAESFDHARHGVVQRDWRAFSLSLDPPPYCEEPVKEDPPVYYEDSESEQVVGKRRRDQWSLLSGDEGRKRQLLSPQPIGSPTEVNTPSTKSPSPSTSIRPTYFARAPSPGRAERNKLARLEHELGGVSDELIRELLIRSGHQHLLAIPKAVDKDVDRDLSYESEKSSSTEVEVLERRLKRYVDETIERRLKSHFLDEIANSAVSDCRDKFFDECKTHEAEFRDQVDDGNCEVRLTTNECMHEIKDQAQKHMREIEEQAHQYLIGIEDQAELAAEEKVAKLKRCFDSAQSLLCPNELGTTARRSSF